MPERVVNPAELLIAANPDPDSTLPYLLRLPLGEGLVFRTSGTWPRTKALYCHPVGLEEWPRTPEIVEQVPVRSCVRRGAAIDLHAPMTSDAEQLLRDRLRNGTLSMRGAQRVRLLALTLCDLRGAEVPIPAERISEALALRGGDRTAALS